MEDDLYFFTIRPHGVLNLPEPSVPFFSVKTTHEVVQKQPTKASTASHSFPVR